jgi:hypothetical protein
VECGPDGSNCPNVADEVTVIGIGRPINEWHKTWCKGVCSNAYYVEGEEWARNLHGIEEVAGYYYQVWSALVGGVALQAETWIGKALIGGTLGASGNVGSQMVKAKPGPQSLNAKAVATSAVLGAAGTALGTGLFGKDMPLQWKQENSLGTNLIRFTTGQMLFSAFTAGTMPIVGLINGTNLDEELAASGASTLLTGGRVLLWNIAGARWPGLAIGEPLQIGADKAISVGQGIGLQSKWPNTTR